MPIATVQLDDGRIVKLEVPEGASEGQITSFISQNIDSFKDPVQNEGPAPVQQDQPKNIASQVSQPKAETPQQKFELLFDEPALQRYQFKFDELTQAGVPRDTADRVAKGFALLDGGDFKTQLTGIPSAAATILSGAVAEPLAGLSGLAASAIPGMPEGVGARTVESVREALTVDPTRTGEAALGSLGRTLAPFVDPASKAVKSVAEFSAESTGSPLVGALVEGSAAAVPEILGLKGFRRMQLDAPSATEAAQTTGNSILERTKAFVKGEKTPTQQVIEDKIKAGDSDVDFLGKQVVDGDIVKTQGIPEARKQGFDDKALRSVETANPETKASLSRMVDIMKRRMKSADFSATNRVTDVVGDSVANRYKALVTAKRKAGADVNIAAKDLKGESIDINPSMDKFFDELSEIGIDIQELPNGKFKADFTNLDASDVGGTRKAVQGVLSRLNNFSGDAFAAHKIKRLIDDSVDFGKLPTADSRLANGVETVLKRFRGDISSTLNEAFDTYGTANKTFASIVEPLSDMDRVFKSILNSSSDEALSAGLGSKAARTIMSNNAGRAAMLNVLKEADEALKARGVTFNDDIIKQAVFADELERVFGTQASTSLGGASQRATEAAIKSALGGDIVTELLSEAGKAITGKNPDKALQAIEKVVKSGAKQQ